MEEEQKLKAIETRFKGFRFRSRLEARWAVFLDTLGIRFEYEAEGYDLTIPRVDEQYNVTEESVWYLPDFWIPEWDAFVEVKPAGPIPQDARDKAEILSWDSKKPVIILAGQPWPGDYDAFAIDPQWVPRDRPGFISQCMATQTIWIRSKDKNDDWGILLSKDKLALWNPDGRARYAFWPQEHEYLQAAYQAAREARFEGRRR